ncbi:cation-translocating P-type ATPase [Oscillospiraceae bacterium HV4-5-C5C]|nr:cation-translocating P-type ATPase [Oscillospiraceae bacterium HV4-5-C5C]
MQEETQKRQISAEELYQGSTAELLTRLASDPERGLSATEASARLESYGPNRLKETKKEPFIKKLLRQFMDYMTLILIVASIISGFLGDWIEALVIIAIVIVNAILGVYQEGKAEKAVEALQKMASPRARVLRDGRQQMVDSAELVPGDVVLLEAGDVVPADVRLLSSVNLKAEEASLTGESVPVDKDAAFAASGKIGIGDRQNAMFSSTNVTYGKGKAVVGMTGAHTEIGRIADRIQGIQDEETPLQQNLNGLGKILGTICLIVSAIVFIVGVISGGEVMKMFMTAVSLAVAAIPEGLNVVVTIVLALGMKRMADRNAIVKRLLAVETLGSVDVICSDKTGTLTQNEMTVTKFYAGQEIYDLEGVGYAPKGEIKLKGKAVDSLPPVVQRLLTVATLCNDAQLQAKADGSYTMLGDPTEGAMLTAAGKAGLTKEQLEAQYPKLDEMPFDSDRKMMTVFHKGIEGPDSLLSLTKGAPDIILARCDREMTAAGVQELTTARRAEIMSANTAFAQTALRVLAFAYRTHTEVKLDEAEQHLTFVGLMGMIDPARPEARDAIALCTRAGIRAVMITGDHKDTAVAIAKDLGLMRPEDEAVTGAQLDEMSDEDLRRIVDHTAVYARVSPEHKVRIVAALRDTGHIASMTGDGVNDAPALKQADIGVAMGITGTEVAKGAADMILTDDNFATIVSAVSEGRVIFANIRKFVAFLLSCNVGEILVIFLSSMILGPTFAPLTPIQLLWLNLVTDSFPALALGNEKAETDIMDRPPRPRSEHIINKPMVLQIVVQSLAIFLAVFAAFNIGRYVYPDYVTDDRGEVVYVTDAEGNETPQLQETFEFFGHGNAAPSNGAETYAFVVLIMAELLRAFSCRSDRHSVFSMGFFSNQTLVKATLLSFALVMVVLYVPFLEPIFNTVPPTLKDWGIMIPLMLVPFIIGELFKVIYYRKDNDAVRQRQAGL